MKFATYFSTGLRLKLFSFLALSIVQLTNAQSHHEPPRPAVAPLIAERYDNDADGDRIDDMLLDRAKQAFAAQRAAGSPVERSQAQAKLVKLVDVELIFKEPVTQRQIDTFTALGGEITYVYKTVSY